MGSIVASNVSRQNRWRIPSIEIKPSKGGQRSFPGGAWTAKFDRRLVSEGLASRRSPRVDGQACGLANQPGGRQANTLATATIFHIEIAQTRFRNYFATPHISILYSSPPPRNYRVCRVRSPDTYLRVLSVILSAFDT
jgi:hypothetical protein